MNKPIVSNLNLKPQALYQARGQHAQSAKITDGFVHDCITVRDKLLAVDFIRKTLESLMQEYGLSCCLNSIAKLSLGNNLESIENT